MNKSIKDFCNGFRLDSGNVTIGRDTIHVGISIEGMKSNLNNVVKILK
jgi:hypothetical protein